MKNPDGDAPQAPANDGHVVSIVGELSRRRLKRERERASAMHLRELESSLEMAEHTAALEGLDLEAGLASLEGLTTDEARSSRAQLRTLRGLQRCLHGDTEAGFADWAEAIAEAPEDAGAYMFRARWRMRTDPAASLEDFDRAASVEPSNAAVYARRGDCYVALGDEDRALANFRRAVALDPSLFDVHCFMARVFAGRGEHAEARAAYDRAIGLAPRYVDFYLGRAESLEQLGELAGAIRDYDRILELDPTRDDARSHRALLYARTGDVGRSIDELAVVVGGDLAEGPGAHETFTLLGGIRLTMGQRAEAIEDFTRALALAPDDVSAAWQRGKAYWETGEYQRALDDFDRAIELAPEESKHHVSRANALAKLDRMADAVEALTRALALAPDDAPAYMLRAIYGSHAEDTEESLERVKADLGRALEISPNELTYLRKRGEYLMHLEEYGAALVDLEKARALAPEVAELHYGCGFCQSRRADEYWDIDYHETPEEKQARCAAALADLEKAYALGLHTEDVHWELVCVREQLGDGALMLAELDRAIVALPDLLPLYALRQDRRRRGGDIAGADADKARMAELGFVDRQD